MDRKKFVLTTLLPLVFGSPRQIVLAEHDEEMEYVAERCVQHWVDGAEPVDIEDAQNAFRYVVGRYQADPEYTHNWMRLMTGTPAFAIYFLQEAIQYVTYHAAYSPSHLPQPTRLPTWLLWDFRSAIGRGLDAALQEDAFVEGGIQGPYFSFQVQHAWNVGTSDLDQVGVTTEYCKKVREAHLRKVRESA